MCQAACGHMPLPGDRAMFWCELAPGDASDRRMLSSLWLENTSPPGTPASSADYRVFRVSYEDAPRVFEACPRCHRDKPMSFRRGHMCCPRCNRRWPLHESLHELARGEEVECS